MDRIAMETKIGDRTINIHTILLKFCPNRMIFNMFFPEESAIFRFLGRGLG